MKGRTEITPDEAFLVLTGLFKELPYNRMKSFAHIHLENSRCDIIMPLKFQVVDKQTEEAARQVKKTFQDLANTAKL